MIRPLPEMEHETGRNSDDIWRWPDAIDEPLNGAAVQAQSLCDEPPMAACFVQRDLQITLLQLIHRRPVGNQVRCSADY